MSVDFTIKDFAYPFSILKLRLFLEKSQWFSEERLQEYQLKKLKMILHHAYENVTYYRNLFNNLKLTPHDFKHLEDLRKLPLLTKEILKNNSKQLVAKNAKRFNPIYCRTSGSSGEPVEFYLDKPSNVLEFCYYWRYWSWAGYRLRNTFAELASHYFLTHRESKNKKCHFDWLTQRLYLNSILLSYDSTEEYINNVRKYKPIFFKGLASSLYFFAVLLKEKGVSDITFKGIFSTGEVLLSNYRETIEEVFHCKVYDSYGHMERTIAISECPQGGYHVNSEYGIMELEERCFKKSGSKENVFIGKVVGTSLHNFSMPLIRYDVGDLVEVSCKKRICACGRGLPVIKKIHGREEDSIITPGGRIVTPLFTVFEFMKDIELGQIVQEKKDKILLRIVKSKQYTPESEEKNISTLRDFVGSDMKIDIEYTTIKKLRESGPKKFRAIISNL